jgi:hypothetical protein
MLEAEEEQDDDEHVHVVGDEDDNDPRHHHLHGKAHKQYIERLAQEHVASQTHVRGPVEEQHLFELHQQELHASRAAESVQHRVEAWS